MSVHRNGSMRAWWRWKQEIFFLATVTLLLPKALSPDTHNSVQMDAILPGEESGRRDSALLLLQELGEDTMIPKSMREGYRAVADQNSDGQERHDDFPERNHDQEQLNPGSRGNSWESVKWRRHNDNSDERWSHTHASVPSHARTSEVATGCRDGWGEHPIECLRSSISRAAKKIVKRGRGRVHVKDAHDGISRERERINREV
jgi:hypothetical protein